MVQTRKQLSQMQQQFGEKASRSRSIVPATARITNFFHMRKRKNSSDRKGVEVLGKRLRGDANATHREEKKTTVTTVISPLGIFDRLPSHIFDTFAISASWRSLINFAQSSKTCAARIVGFIHREMCVSRFVREAEVYVVNRGKAGEEDPFVNLENLCRAVFQSTECSRELLQFCTKASARITDTRRWSRFLFVISSLLTSSNGNYDHCKQIIELILEMKVSLSEGFTEKRSIRELLMEVVFTQEAGELPEEEMKIRQVVRDLFIDQTLDEQQQAIWLTCLMRTFPKLQQQARLLMIALSPTITVDGSEIVDWRSLCDRDVTDQKDAALRVRPLALVISKLTSSSACRDRRMSWTNTELFNLIEEVSTCPEPWAFDNFIAFLVQEPSLIPIALTARMTHDYVEEAGNLVSAMKTLLFRWNVPFSQGLSKAFNSTMKSLSMSLRREFLSSVHEAHARTIKSLVTSARGEIEEEICAQAQFVPLLQEVVVLFFSPLMWPEGSRIALLIRSIVRPHSNCSILDPPSGTEFLSHLEPWHIVFISIAGLLTLAVILLSLVHLICVYFYCSIEQRRNKLYFLVHLCNFAGRLQSHVAWWFSVFLVTLFPMACVSSLVSIIIPRAAVILSSIGVLYYLLCLFVIVSLCRHLYGGRSALVERLRHRRIEWSVPPFCCLFPIGWLPTAEVSEENIRWIEYLVLQAPIVRAIIVAANTVAIAELREESTGFLKWTDTGAVASLLLAIFGVHSLARLTAEPLRAYCFMTVFRMVDLSLLFFTAQQPMIFENILLRFDLIPCGPLLSAESNAKFVCSFILVVQMFFLSLLSSYLLAPHRCALFDNFPSRKETLSQTTDETDLTVEAEDGWMEREERDDTVRLPSLHHSLLIDTTTSSA